MTDVNIRSLADFKRFLGRPRATIETLRNDVMTRNGKTRLCCTNGRFGGRSWRA